MPRLEQILLVRPGHDEPEKTSVPLMTWLDFPRGFSGACGGWKVKRVKKGKEKENPEIRSLKQK